jgi:ankyrin repeat protein
MKKIVSVFLATCFLCFLFSCVSSGTKRPPLYQAVLDDNILKVRQLVEAGADINSGVRGTTPLEIAASKGNLEIVEYLLSRGAQNPERAFIVALDNRHANVVKYFIDSGHVDADINKYARYFRAYLNDKDTPFEQRMQNIKEITGDRLNSPYLLALVEQENYQRVNDFFRIQLTARVDELNNTILHIAADHNNDSLVTYLLERNFNVNLLNNNNHTALFYAITIYGPSINWANPIIENEASARINFSSDMPFYFNPQNVQERQIRIVTSLLNKNININQQDKSGWTVLHFACRSYPAGLQELLISKGANQTLKTTFGRTSADMLELRNNR